MATVPSTSAPVLPAGSRDAFALIQRGPAASAPEQLLEIDLHDAATKRGPRITGSSFLVVDGPALDVVSPSSFDSRGNEQGPYLLRRISLSTMSLGRPVVLGNIAQAAGVAAAIAFQPTGSFAGDLWEAADGQLKLVDPWTGAVLKTLALPPNQGYAVAVEPDGRFVDVSALEPVLAPAAPFGGEVLEIDSFTLAVVHRLTGLPSIETPQLEAVPGGLWVSYRGGMLGTTIHVAESGFVVDVPITPGGSNSHPAPGRDITMGEWPFLAGEVLLLADTFGMACLSPAGTKLLASAPFPGGTWSSSGSSWKAFAGIGRVVYAVAPASRPSVERIIAVTLPDACW